MFDANRSEAERLTIMRAWRDPNFRASLSESARSSLPLHPISTGDDGSDWTEQLGAMAAYDDPAITLGGGCGTLGCTALVCTDPCGTYGSSCPNNTEQDTCVGGACTLKGGSCTGYDA